MEQRTKQNMEKDFTYFDINLFQKEEQQEIVNKNLVVLNFPKSLEQEDLLGYAIDDEIKFNNLKDNKIILLRKGLRGFSLRMTFWHEVAHFLLRENNNDKQMSKIEKEDFCEGYAIQKVNKGGHTLL